MNLKEKTFVIHRGQQSPLKCMINKKNRLSKTLKDMVINHRTDNVMLDNFRKECLEAVENAKLSLLTNLGRKLHNPKTSHKFYWKIINVKLLKFHLSL